MCLPLLNIPIALNTSKDNLIDNFFVPLLQNSIKYDRGVGYFSSNWIREAFRGMDGFSSHGGKARWITSPILSEEDWEALLLGSEAKQNEILKRALGSVIYDLCTALQRDTLIALSWMIADDIIEFKLAKPRNNLSGEYHAKVGVFTDMYGNCVSFDGSYNDSITGLHNFESIKVFRSWDSTSVYVEQEKHWFEKIWQNQDPNIEVFDIPDAAIADILKIRENNNRPYPQPDGITISSLRELADIKIPSPANPKNIKLRDYQNEAIDSWFENQNKGIFEMATGTGKTITALSLTLRLLKENRNLFSIISCPYIHLAQQWVQEAKKFGYRPILIAESKNKWFEEVYKFARDFKAGRIEQGMIVTTNASFLSSDLRNIIDEYNLWGKILWISDEVHHCGSQEMLKSLPEKIPYRLGLSATPMRGYDEIGSKGLIAYFGEVIYKFDLKNAIDQGFLTPYFYYPLPVYLTDKEFEEFIVLTKKLHRLHPDPEQPISEDALKIAIKRAKVQNNSQSKIGWIQENIHEAGDYSYTLFYVGEQIFNEIRALIGYKKRIPIHEFTYRQNLSERVDLLAKFSKGDIQAFIAMKCLDEGIDIPPTRTAYFLASASVSREFVQRRGRILRNSPGKKFATIYDLISVPPLEYIIRGKDDENYSAVRSAIRREYLRVKEFASLAENKYQSMDKFLDIANKFDLLDV